MHDAQCKLTTRRASPSRARPHGARRGNSLCGSPIAEVRAAAPLYPEQYDTRRAKGAATNNILPASRTASPEKSRKVAAPFFPEETRPAAAPDSPEQRATQRAKGAATKIVARSIPSIAASSAAPPRKRSEKFPPCLSLSTINYQLWTGNRRTQLSIPNCPALIATRWIRNRAKS
jgi:hypothetical protein